MRRNESSFSNLVKTREELRVLIEGQVVQYSACMCIELNRC